MQCARISHGIKGYFSPPCPPKHFALIFASSELQQAKGISDYTDSDGIFSCWPANIPWTPRALLVFLPCSTHIPFSATPEKENSTATLSGKQQEKLPAGLGACEESTGKQSPTESTQGQRMKNPWSRRHGMGKGQGSSSGEAVDMQ